jgi:hypothetical protein
MRSIAYNLILAQELENPWYHAELRITSSRRFA